MIHGPSNVKFINAQQAKIIHIYENIKNTVYLVGMYIYIAKNDTRTFRCQVRKLISLFHSIIWHIVLPCCCTFSKIQLMTFLWCYRTHVVQ